MVARRGILIGAAGVTTAVLLDLVAGHGNDQHTAVRPRPATTKTSADPRLRDAAAMERRLVTAYEVATAAHPALTATLAVPAAHHRAHLAALTGTATPEPTTTAPVTSGPLSESGAAQLRAVLGALAAQEQAAADSYAAAAALDLAEGGLLASVSASEAVHVLVLQAAVAAVQATVVPPPPSTVRYHRETPTATPTPTPTPTPTSTPTRPTPSRTRPSTPSSSPTHTAPTSPSPTTSTSS